MTSAPAPPEPSRRSGASRVEVVITLVLVALTALGVAALWPRGPGSTERPPASAPAAVRVDDTELAPLRVAARLEPCPPPGPAASSGALAGVVLPCLGEPGTADLGSALAGRPALINVWASWCAPCRAELPALAEYAARPGAVPVIGVDVQDDPRAALRLLTDLGVTLPSFTDPDGALRAALDIPPVLPVSYVVGADGRVVRVDPPTPFRSADEVAAAVHRLAS